MPLTYPGEQPELAARDAAHERARKVRPELATGEPVRVAWASNQAEAELIQGLLLEEGVPSYVRRSRGFDVPDMLAAGPRDVLVPSAGAEAARALLRAADLEELAVEPVAPPTLALHVTLAVLVAAGGFVTAVVTWLLMRAVG
jgi:hypothetical protein